MPDPGHATVIKKHGWKGWFGRDKFMFTVRKDDGSLFTIRVSGREYHTFNVGNRITHPSLSETEVYRY